MRARVFAPCVTGEEMRRTSAPVGGLEAGCRSAPPAPSPPPRSCSRAAASGDRAPLHWPGPWRPCPAPAHQTVTAGSASLGPCQWSSPGRDCEVRGFQRASPPDHGTMAGLRVSGAGGRIHQVQAGDPAGPAGQTGCFDGTLNLSKLLKLCLAAEAGPTLAA